jgi:PAS domain S-box-containing protein
LEETAAPVNKLLAGLLDASVDGVLAFDRECRYTVWNSAMERISGLPREQVLGRRAFEVFPFLEATGVDRYFYEALAGRTAKASARPYTVPETGQSGFFDGHYSPLRDESGAVVGGVGVIRDITASRAAEEALRESRERYRAFIANSSEGIWRVELEEPIPVGQLDADEQIERFCRHGYIAECNDAMARMYGFARAEELAGARLGDLLVRDDPQNEEYLRAFIASGYRLTEAESAELDREGRARFFSNNLVGVVAGGLVWRAWGTQRDITERRRIEDALKATEHRFSMFMEHLPGLAWIKDLAGRYVYVNEAAARAFRTPREELLGKSDEEIFPPATAAQFRENDRLALSASGVLTVERLAQPDGDHHSIVSKFPIPGPSGEPALVGGVAIDVTEQMRAEEALRESEEKYRSLLENANDIIYSHDLDGNYLTINRACAEVTGYTREEILGGLNIKQVVVPEHLERAKKMMEQKLRDPSPTVYEIDILTKDGRRLTLEVSTRIARREGRGPAVEGIARDVTDRKRAEREREELLAREQAARREAEEASSLKDEFLATVSHELRTPLTAILGWSQMLRRGVRDEATREHALEVIERNALAQKQLVGDILDVSRIITGRLRIEVRPVELIPVVEAAREAVQPAAEARGIRLDAAYDVGDLNVLGDPDRLQQIVWNLLANAVKFTAAGGRVALTVERAGDSVRLSVSDTGEGIAAEFLPHVFERFRQADMGTTRRHGGLGLGLSIVRHLVEMHGGTVRAESAGEGRGSTFTVQLPLLRSADRGVRNEEQDETETPADSVESAVRDPHSAILNGLRLLVVDDEPDTLELLRLSLGGHGAEVWTAESAGAALELFGRARPHLVISDVGMPLVDGYEFLRRLRARGWAGPAIALTAYARAEDRARSLASGFSAHVAKPVEPDALAGIVAGLIGDA